MQIKIEQASWMEGMGQFVMAKVERNSLGWPGMKKILRLRCERYAYVSHSCIKVLSYTV